jgi:hypothetical protein
MAMRMGPATCQRCSEAPAVDLHEPRTRARGGDASDPAECIPLCRSCHDWIHEHPAEATREGFLTPSWDEVAEMEW